MSGSKRPTVIVTSEPFGRGVSGSGSWATTIPSSSGVAAGASATET
jgi:hypothetical protein